MRDERLYGQVYTSRTARSNPHYTHPSGVAPTVSSSPRLGRRDASIERVSEEPKASWGTCDSLDGSHIMEDLARRQLSILARLQTLEGKLGFNCDDSNEKYKRFDSSNDADGPSTTNLGRLTNELHKRGITRYRFVRAPSDYYDRPLEYRREILGAKSTHHLCKSIVMENTRVDSDVDPGMSKYWMVIVQYTARLHADKLRSFVHSHHGDLLSKSKINMRLCAEEVSSRLTGFERNAVSPVGCKTTLPIIMSHKIANLAQGDPDRDIFWLGAGEVDLKIGINLNDFISAFSPFIVDCTYDD